MGYHPNLENISFPRTKKSTKAYRNSWKVKSSDISTTSDTRPKQLSSSKSKPKHLSGLEVSECMVKNNIHHAEESTICSLNILQKNGINPYVYADAIRHLLIHGHGKFRNVMKTGPENCGKTFMLKPLQIILQCIQQPIK